MQVNPTVITAPPPQSAGAPLLVRVLAGDLTAVPVGQLLRATVAGATVSGTHLTIAGQSLTVAPPLNLAPGTAVAVRLPGTSPAVSMVEVVGLAADAPATAAAPTPQTASIPVAVADVLARTPDGRVQVQLNGQPATAATAEPLTPGGRYVVQVETTPAGLVLRSAPDAAAPADAAAAVLRAGKPPDLGAAVGPLLAELSQLRTPGPAAAPAVRDAAAAVQEVVRSFLPADGKPPDAEQIRALVEDGGLHFEAKLARLADEGAPDPRAAASAAAGDLKGALLKLIQVAREAGAAVPAAAAAVESVESQQAANALAQPAGGPFFLQVPFPDDGRWKTLALAVEPDRAAHPDAGGPPAGARVLMHVPLSRLGETWVDAGLSAGRVRAVVYLESAADRDRVRAAFPGLRDALRADGFADVLLDARPPADLPAARKAAARAGRPASIPVLDVRA